MCTIWLPARATRQRRVLLQAPTSLPLPARRCQALPALSHQRLLRFGEGDCVDIG